MRILAIESSCDETSAAVMDYARGRFAVRSNIVYSQVALHAKTGGVVPEVAAREHSVKIVPVLDRAVKEARATKDNVDALAVTAGPGLMTSLMVGVEAARTLACLWRKPLIPVNHIEAHVASCWLSNEPVRFPAVCLVVSGGHTELILMRKQGSYKLLGRTVDDAAGEAFDKVAKILNLGYPGGPLVSRRAEKGDPQRYKLPRPMIGAQGASFSFSGLKTAVMYLVEGVPGKGGPSRHERIDKDDLCASFQQAVVDVLVAKTIREAKRHNAKSVLLAGGVAANKQLRDQLSSAIVQRLPSTSYHRPELRYCTDNAAMIAARAAFAFTARKWWPWEKVRADANWEVW